MTLGESENILFEPAFSSHEIAKARLQYSSETRERCLNTAPGKCPHQDHTSGLVNPNGRKERPPATPASSLVLHVLQIEKLCLFTLIE